MPAKRSINENTEFLGGGKGNGPSMASNILDVLADFIERAGGRIFTQNLHPRMLHPPAIRLSHLHPDLEKVIVLCRRFGYLNPASRHQRSPSQQRKLSFGLFLARQFRARRDLRRSVNHRNRRGEPVRFIRRVRPRHIVVPYRQGLSRGILLAGRLEERGREITAKLRLIDDSSYRRRAVQTSLPP